jgi:hypothetical protein
MLIISFFSFIFLSSCSSLLYYPDQNLYVNPSSQEMSFQEVNLKVEEEQYLNGWYFPSKKPEALVLFFHGNAQNISTHFLSLAWLPQNNVDFFIFDYRGFGASTQISITPESTVQDGMIAIEWAALRAKVLGVPLVVYAQSLGGAISLRSLAELKNQTNTKIVDQFVIDSSFLSYKEAGEKILEQNWFLWAFQWLPYVLLSDKMAPKDHLEKLGNIPFIVMHGTNDRVVNFELGKDLYKKIPSKNKEFWEIKNGGHTDSFWRHKFEYRKKFLASIRKITEL